jgi:hypothetical protein
MDTLFILCVIGLLILLAGFIVLVILRDKRALMRAFKHLSADEILKRKKFLISCGRKKGGGNGN